MADDQEPRRSVHPPAGGSSRESRGETVEKAVRESQSTQGLAERPSESREDPSTRRGFNRALVRRILYGAVIGAAAGVVLALVLRWADAAPLRNLWEDTALNWALWIVLMAAVMSSVVLVLTTLVLLAREDGRVERDVEARTGHPPEGPGRPLDPRHDVKED